MKATKKYFLLIAACAALSVSAVAFTACGDSHTHTLTKTDEVPATCTENGTQAYWTCTDPDCGKMFSDADGKKEITAVVTIPASHTLTKEDEVSATCTAGGAEAYWTCSACEKWFNDAEGKNENEDKTPVAIPAKGHAWDEDFTVDTAATCTEDGSKSIHCKNCEKTKDTTVIPALGGHAELTEIDGIPVTCVTDGMEGYWICYDCGKMYSDENGETEIDAPVVIKAKGAHDELHQTSGWPASCMIGGMEDYWVCYDCGLMYSDAEGKNQIDTPVYTPATGHSYGDTIDTDGAVTGDTVGYACEHCGQLKPDPQYTYFDDNALNDVLYVEAGEYYVEISEDAETDELSLLLNLVSGTYSFSISGVTSGTVIMDAQLSDGTPLECEDDGFIFDATNHAGDYLEITLMFEGAPTFIISVEGEVSRALTVGENTIKITETYEWADIYTFTATEAGVYAITSFNGIDVAKIDETYDIWDFEYAIPIVEANDFIYDDTITGYITLEADEMIKVGFMSVSYSYPVGTYTISIEYIGEAEPAPTLNLDDEGCTIDPFEQNSLTVGEGVAEGQYVLTITPARTDTGIPFTVTVNGEEYTLDMTNDYSVTITLKEGDVLEFETNAFGYYNVTLSTPA